MQTNFTIPVRPYNSLLAILLNILELEDWTYWNQEFSQGHTRSREFNFFFIKSIFLGLTKNLYWFVFAIFPAVKLQTEIILTGDFIYTYDFINIYDFFQNT
jgi:hypothetical protein